MSLLRSSVCSSRLLSQAIDRWNWRAMTVRKTQRFPMTARTFSSMAVLLGLFLVGCAASVSRAPASTASELVVSGSVAYRERVALPPDAVVEVKLLDVSRQDAAAPVIADATVRPEGRQVPLPFELRYDPGRFSRTVRTPFAPRSEAPDG
jgi:putative lipoprotein